MKAIPWLFLIWGCTLMTAVAPADEPATVIALSNAPASMQQAIQWRLGDGKLGKINESTAGGEAFFDGGGAQSGETV